MITLPYGRQVPEVNDQGIPLFQALEDNINLDDSHNHDGINSPVLGAQSFPALADTVSHLNWASVGGIIGHYRQLVTMHAGFLFDSSKIGFRTTSGAYIYPTVERVSNTQYYVYTTDNSQDYVAVYGS